MRSSNLRWNDRNVTENVSKVEKDVIAVFMAVYGEVTDSTKRKISIIGLEPKDALIRVSTQIEMKLQEAMFRMRMEPGRDDSEGLQNVAACHAVLQNRVADVCLDLLNTGDLVAASDADISVVEPGQTEVAILKQSSENGTETGDNKDQY